MCVRVHSWWTQPPKQQAGVGASGACPGGRSGAVKCIFFGWKDELLSWHRAKLGHWPPSTSIYSFFPFPDPPLWLCAKTRQRLNTSCTWSCSPCGGTRRTAQRKAGVESGNGQVAEGERSLWAQSSPAEPSPAEPSPAPGWHLHKPRAELLPSQTFLFACSAAQSFWNSLTVL